MHRDSSWQSEKGSTGGRGEHLEKLTNQLDVGKTATKCMGRLLELMNKCLMPSIFKKGHTGQGHCGADGQYERGSSAT